MDPTHLADEALRRFTALHATRSGAEAGNAPELRNSADEALLEAFQHLAKLDAWAKIAMDRLVADPQDARAAHDLKLSLEQVAGLHPQFTRRLADCLSVLPSSSTMITATQLLQQAQVAGLASSDNRR